MLSGQADGVLLLNGRILQGATHSLADADVPIVAVSMPPTGRDVPAVLVQEREGAAAVAAHLLALGHRRFGYVSGPRGNHIELERWTGFTEALAAAGVSAQGDRPLRRRLPCRQRRRGRPQLPGDASGDRRRCSPSAT